MDDDDLAAFMAAEEDATPLTLATEEAIAESPERLSLSRLKCCLIDAAKAKLIAAGLHIPELAYPSACGDSPPCADKNYLTAFITPPGVQRFDAGVFNEDTSGCSFRRMATLTVGVGLCQPVTWTQENCGAKILGSCDDPQPGTYSYESMRQDDYLDVLTCLSGAFKNCLCVGEAEPCDPIPQALALSCSTPVLIGSDTDCSVNRPFISASYQLAFG